MAEWKEYKTTKIKVGGINFSCIRLRYILLTFKNIALLIILTVVTVKTMNKHIKQKFLFQNTHFIDKRYLSIVFVARRKIILKNFRGFILFAEVKNLANY